MKKRILFSLIFVLTLLVVLLHMENKTVILPKIQVNDYVEYGKIQTPTYGKIQTPTEEKDLFVISFRFFINKNQVQKEVLYENLFQTADVNKGIRVEIFRNQKNQAFSSWALVYSDRQNQLQGIDLGSIPEMETWHDMKILYKGMNDTLTILVDGKMLKTIQPSNISIDFSNIIVGKGFSDRIFSGKISDFRIVNEFEIPAYYQSILLYLLILLITITFFETAVKITHKIFSYIKQFTLLKVCISAISILLFTCMVGIFILKSFYITKLGNYNNVDNPIILNKPLNIVDDFSIEFDFLINANDEQMEPLRYENLFQTADYNDGLRLEIGRKKDGTSLWALLYTDTKGELRAIDLNLMPTPSVWHKMRIHYIKDKNCLDIFLDGINIRSYHKVNLTLNFNEVIVGRGFNDRYFYGEVRNFLIQKDFIETYIYLSLIILSTVLFSLLIFDGLKRHYIVTRNMDDSKTSVKRKWLLQIIYILCVLSGFSFFLFVAESYLVGENEIFRVIITGLTSLGTITLLLFMHNLKVTNYIRRPLLAILYIITYLYIGLFLASSLYVVNRFADDVRRPYGLSIDEIAAVYQSSVSESFQFLVTNLGYWQFVLITLVPLLIVIVIYHCLKKFSPLPNHKLTLTYVLVIIGTFYFMLPHISTFPTSLYAGFMRYSQQVSEFKKFKALKEDINFNVDVLRQTQGTHILVIGESANKEHMSAYGYFRDTTPWMDDNLQNNHFLFFNNAYAPYVHTVPALLKVLTMANQYNGMMQNSAPSILDIAKKAGFKTYWISEQTRAVIDTPLSVLSSVADHVEFVDEGQAILKSLNHTLETINQNENNLIILHLMGSHADYRQRLYGCNYKYTQIKKEEIGNFASDENKDFIDNILNPYDSTIRCTDDKLKQLFDMSAKRYLWVDSFIYLSDHGEDVYGQKFHNSADFSFPMTHIPLVMYFSDRYMAANHEVIANLQSHKKSLFTTDLLFNTLLDIFTLSSPAFEQGYSMAAEDYNISENNAITMQKSPDEDGTFYTLTDKSFIKNDPQYIAEKNIEYLNKKYPNKILSVDNDLIAKVYQSYAYGFHGSEFNVALESLKIGHYPDYIWNTTLDEYLALKPLKMQKKLWFDLKSPRGKNIGYALQKFEELDKKYHLKERALIESWEDGLEQFHDNGWKTLYYIQGRKGSGRSTDYQYNIEAEQRTEEYAKQIARKVITSHVYGVSFFANDYDFVKRYLEPLLPEDITYHVFGFSYDFQVDNKKMIENIEASNIFHDPRVQTILLDGPQMFQYRNAK